MASLSFKNDQRISARDRALLRDFCSSLDREIVELANRLGVKVFEEDLLPYESGFLEYDPECQSESGFKIVINANDYPARRRFTIAHEIAHFLLHKGDAKKRKAHRAEESNTIDPFIYLVPWEQLQEREANSFAAALLMSGNLFNPAYEKLNGNVEALSGLFGVSQKSVMLRIKDLKRS